MDIVERLRYWIERNPRHVVITDVDKAVDEIERLREAVERSRSLADTACAEMERYRADAAEFLVNMLRLQADICSGVLDLDNTDELLRRVGNCCDIIDYRPPKSE